MSLKGVTVSPSLGGMPPTIMNWAPTRDDLPDTCAARSAWICMEPDEVLAISRTPGGGHRREGGAARNSRFLRRTRVVPRFLAISIHMDYQKMDYQAQGDFSSTTPAILRVPSGSQGPRFSRSTCSMPHTCPAGQANSKSGGGPWWSPPATLEAGPQHETGAPGVFSPEVL